MMLRYVSFSNYVLREHISARPVAVPRRGSSAMVGARSMELLLRLQKSTDDLETKSPPLMPALPLLLSPHILPWHILFLVQSKCRFFSHLTSFLGTFCFWRNRKMEEKCDVEIKEYEPL